MNDGDETYRGGPAWTKSNPAGRWVRQRPPVLEPHYCELPKWFRGDMAAGPSGQPGDVWRCACGRLFVVVGDQDCPYWINAGWLLRLRFRNK
jgi:hypothetical protein